MYYPCSVTKLKSTKPYFQLLSLQKEFEDLQARFDESEKGRTFLKLELDDLMSSKDDAGKSVS